MYRAMKTSVAFFLRHSWLCGLHCVSQFHPCIKKLHGSLLFLNIHVDLGDFGQKPPWLCDISLQCNLIFLCGRYTSSRVLYHSSLYWGRWDCHGWYRRSILDVSTCAIGQLFAKLSSCTWISETHWYVFQSSRVCWQERGRGYVRLLSLMAKRCVDKMLARKPNSGTSTTYVERESCRGQGKKDNLANLKMGRM